MDSLIYISSSSSLISPLMMEYDKKIKQKDEQIQV